jgi:hypothetical protein
VTNGSQRCAMYANSRGFGGWCGGTDGGARARTWRERLDGHWPFVDCRDYPIPEGWRLPKPPAGKAWAWRAYIRDYDLDKPYGGPNVHLEYALVAVTQQDRDACDIAKYPYMDPFWDSFAGTYPAPVLNIAPTYIPRVNSPAFFSLGMDTTKTPPLPSDRTLIYNNHFDGGPNGWIYLAMQAVVSKLKIDAGDGTPPFECQVVNEVYDMTKPPTEQTNVCKHVFTRSSASQPDGMYTVKVSSFWTVSYCTTPDTETDRDRCDWHDLGTFEVKSVQKLPVQEVQGVGGGR